MTSIADATSTGSLSTEKVTYRGFVKYNEKGEITDVNAKAESSQKDEKTGQPKNWVATLEKGFSEWNTNEFVRYTVKDESGFKLLVPDDQQRVYIIQSGLNYIQNAKASGFMTEIAENKTDPAHNDETIDLKDSINEPPTKRALSDEDKLFRQLTAMGLTKEAAIAMFQQIAGKLPSNDAPAATEEVAEEVAEGVEG